ncbi:hypothetical protein TWF718_010940 [Orbilia javanica]|uniref:Uncharacterized protein n=1 Tax=Orbilia javanica TaxID=47235 RepID=A0AAN8MR34_9PEZI
MRKAVQLLSPAHTRALVTLGTRIAAAATTVFIVKSFAAVQSIVQEDGRGVHARAANLALQTDAHVYGRIGNAIPIFAQVVELTSSLTPFTEGTNKKIQGWQP